MLITNNTFLCFDFSHFINTNFVKDKEISTIIEVIYFIMHNNYIKQMLITIRLHKINSDQDYNG